MKEERGRSNQDGQRYNNNYVQGTLLLRYIACIDDYRSNPCDFHTDI